MYTNILYNFLWVFCLTSSVESQIPSFVPTTPVDSNFRFLLAFLNGLWSTNHWYIFCKSAVSFVLWVSDISLWWSELVLSVHDNSYLLLWITVNWWAVITYWVWVLSFMPPPHVKPPKVFNDCIITCTSHWKGPPRTHHFYRLSGTNCS